MLIWGGGGSGLSKERKERSSRPLEAATGWGLDVVGPESMNEFDLEAGAGGGARGFGRPTDGLGLRKSSNAASLPRATTGTPKPDRKSPWSCEILSSKLSGLVPSTSARKSKSPDDSSRDAFGSLAAGLREKR